MKMTKKFLKELEFNIKYQLSSGLSYKELDYIFLNYEVMFK